MKSRSIKKVIITLAVLIILLGVFLEKIILFITDYWWFKDLGYTQVFFTQLFTELKIGIPVFIVMTILSILYLQTIKKAYFHHVREYSSTMSDIAVRRVTVITGIVFALFISLMVTADFWDDVLYAANSTGFGKEDPIFGLDISFYVFKLALIDNISGLLFTLVFFFIIISLLYYIFLSTVRKPEAFREEEVFEAEEMPKKGKGRIFGNLFGSFDAPSISTDLSAGSLKTMFSILRKQYILLGIVFFLAVALYLVLKQFGLLYSDTGVVFGAGFTDVHIGLNVYRIEVVLAVAAAVAFVIFSLKKKYKKILIVPVLMICVAILGGIASTALQALVVSPDELDKESKYLQDNISYTQEAYGLDKVTKKSYSAKGTLTAENIANNQPTVCNIRINDFDPSKQFYNQTQSIRSYYNFKDVDNDRYMINGDYTQTFLSVRELETDNLGTDVSWLTTHIKYTHGYGLTLSRVDAVTDTGQPDMLISSIPPVSKTEDIQINRPEIYYGESTVNYAITNTDEPEFDYPTGDENAYSVYEGKTGVKLTPLKRLFYAIKEHSLKILVSSNINSDSKILYNRDIQTRLGKFTPFLEIDSDPYMVVSDSGQLYWMVDAYTESANYPYSKRTHLEDGSTFNYMRNPVKITVNAYDGTVNFYKVSEDPIIDTISKIYPGMIKDVSEMPDGLEKHIMYSSTLFDVQAKIYQRYHMSNVSVFYQNEDKWSIASNVYGQEEVEMHPNYYIMKLPGEDSEEFIDYISFTPSGKKNMTGMMIARCDGENYGEIILYSFPKDSVVYGPQQIESQIDQNTEISKEFSLWNSSGSTYTRGDMFVIPIDDALLYVEPVYLESSNDSSLPEVKRVIVVYEDKIAYGETLDESLTKLFGSGDESGTAAPSQNDQIQPDGDLSVNELAELAAQAFDDSNAALKSGDWKSYGEYQQKLRQYLEEMKSASGADGVTAEVPEETVNEADIENAA